LHAGLSRGDRIGAGRRGAATIRRATLEILEQAGDRRGLVLGIAEDIPPAQLERSCSAILEALRQHPLD